MKRIVLVFAVLFTVLSSHAESLKLDVKRFNDQVELFEVGQLEYMPQMRLLKYYAPRLSDSVVLYDLSSGKASILAKQGEGPEQFKNLRAVFTDGGNIYLYDLVSSKLLKYDYQQNTSRLLDIIPVKMLGKIFRFGERDLLGKLGNRWIVQNSVYRDLPELQNQPEKFPMTTDTYIGTLSEDFLVYDELIQVKGGEYPRMCQSYDNAMFSVGNENYIVQLTAVNFDSDKRELLVPVTNMETGNTSRILVSVPEKYTRYQPMPWKKNAAWRLKQSKYKYVPMGARFFGLDEQYYFCYFHHNNEDNFDILYNVLDFNTMTVAQYEQPNATMKPMLADADGIAFLDETDPDRCKLTLSPKRAILAKKLNEYR